MATVAANEGLEWHFSQVFGERTPGEELIEADIISAVEFDQTGDYLATGDRGGRVVLFERVGVPKPTSRAHIDDRPAQLPINPFEYRYLTEFQSHEPEFDYLKSSEIEEKINQIRWLPQWRGTGSHLVLTTNDKTVKLWKVYERQLTSLADFNLQNTSSNVLNSNSANYKSPDKSSMAALAARGATSRLRVPRVVGREGILSTKCRRTYSSAHAYHINSVSLSSDQETFLSADDLRINLWHLDRPDLSFNIVDIKPSSMEDLTEVITRAEFHPQECHTLAYSSSKGCIRIADMRAAALCDQHAKIFESPETQNSSKSFFTEIIASVNDLKFLPDGRHVLARDYMTLKVWDLAMEKQPVVEIPVHEPVRRKLCELYENDCIFDKFDCCTSGDGKHFATGTYSNFFKVFGQESKKDQLLEVSRDPARRRIATMPQQQQAKSGGRFGAFGRGLRDKSGNNNNAAAVTGDELILTDFGTKVNHLAWHPSANVVATAASNALYLFYGRDLVNGSSSGHIAF